MVLPSTSEPWGLVVNEALSMGCPVIVSNRCGCLPELVISGKTGFEFQSGDAMDLARKMTAINLDMKDVDNVSIACIEHMRKFSPNNAAVQIIQGCRSILTMTHAK